MTITTPAELAKSRNNRGITIRDGANAYGIDGTLQAIYEVYPGRYILRILFANGRTTERVYAEDHQFVI